MWSNDLGKYGFRNGYYSFNKSNKVVLLKELPEMVGVYVLRKKSSFPRLKGETDIVYIGRSTYSLRKRIRLYFNPGPTQFTAQRINKLLDKVDDLEITYYCPENSLDDIVVELEGQLLKDYENDHWELPPFNRQGYKAK